MSDRKQELQSGEIGNITFDFFDSGIERVLEDHGVEYKRTVGSHHTFSYTIDEELDLFTVPYKRPLKIVYVKHAFKIIDQLIAMQENSDEQDD